MNSNHINRYYHYDAKRSNILKQYNCMNICVLKLYLWKVIRLPICFLKRFYGILFVQYGGNNIGFFSVVDIFKWLNISEYI